jgi:hypothetical protein
MRAQVCSKCEADEEADFEKVRDALDQLQDQNVEQIVESTGVSSDCVLRLIKDGRITDQHTSLTVECGMCGRPAMSIKKRLCESCLNKLNNKVLIDANRVRSTQAAKSVGNGMGMGTGDRVAEKRGK